MKTIHQLILTFMGMVLCGMGSEIKLHNPNFEMSGEPVPGWRSREGEVRTFGVHGQKRRVLIGKKARQVWAVEQVVKEGGSAGVKYRLEVDLGVNQRTKMGEGTWSASVGYLRAGKLKPITRQQWTLKKTSLEGSLSFADSAEVTKGVDFILPQEAENNALAVRIEADGRLPWMGVSAVRLVAGVEKKGAVAETLKDSFEASLPSEFVFAESALGSWKAADGHVQVVASHKRSGSQSLLINSGEKRTVELHFSKPLSEARQLHFWANRWTQRAPFSFKVMQLTKGKWTLAYDGDKKVVIGAFSSEVSMRLAKGVEAIKIAVTSPNASAGGALIDDVVLRPVQ